MPPHSLSDEDILVTRLSSAGVPGGQPNAAWDTDGTDGSDADGTDGSDADGTDGSGDADTTDGKGDQ
ncbi:MAG: hypothetical protein K0Q72_3733 [Armatimonadetes bacterium]|jgi:hypothetical protein|nr:hypothetical protein [Armatimonadota bacterium]